MIIKKAVFESMLARLPDETRNVAESLVDQVVFLNDTLNNLAEIIARDGVMTTRQNGNKVMITAEHPALKSYNTTMRNYSALCKVLAKYLPKPDDDQEDELMTFLANRNRK